MIKDDAGSLVKESSEAEIVRVYVKRLYDGSRHDFIFEAMSTVLLDIDNLIRSTAVTVPYQSPTFDAKQCSSQHEQPHHPRKLGLQIPDLKSCPIELGHGTKCRENIVPGLFDRRARDLITGYSSDGV